MGSEILKMKITTKSLGAKWFQDLQSFWFMTETLNTKYKLARPNFKIFNFPIRNKILNNKKNRNLQSQS